MRLDVSKETGEENAERFVRVVREESMEHKVIILYAEIGTSSYADPNKVGWTWMKNRNWRDRVLMMLADEEMPSVTEPRFLPPDNLDGWVFVGLSASTRHRVEDLRLDETLAKRPRTLWQRLKWFFTATSPQGELG